MKKILFSFLFVGVFLSSQAQFGYGLTFTSEIYQRYTNPEDSLDVYRSAGSLMLNPGIGPKIWFGGNDFSVSLEAQATIGLLGLAISDYKGLGTASFPLMAKFNFGGLTGLDKEGEFGWSLGAGIQYSKTELFYLANKYEDQGLERDLFKTYVGQINYGFGMSGFGGSAFIRYGYNSETKANNFNWGIQFDFNFKKLNEIIDPESDL